MMGTKNSEAKNSRPAATSVTLNVRRLFLIKMNDVPHVRATKSNKIHANKGLFEESFTSEMISVVTNGKKYIVSIRTVLGDGK